jgi:SAM-dependent methyltransferase
MHVRLVLDVQIPSRVVENEELSEFWSLLLVARPTDTFQSVSRLSGFGKMPSDPEKLRESYRREYFEANKPLARNSARKIAPMVLDLVQPNSVLDVGCGTGSWLAVFRDLGVEDIIGIDAEWIDRDSLEIPVDHFLTLDLEKPFDLKRRFDLVLSLEVGEHLAPDSAEILVDNLTRAGPVILFSAAVPFSGGTHHVNEQWPEYWAEKFRARGYSVIDCIRSRVWTDPAVTWWYAQGALLLAEADTIERIPRLRAEQKMTSGRPLSLVHPTNYLRVANPPQRTFWPIFWDLVNWLKRKRRNP